MKYRVGTRGSRLALAQTEQILEQMRTGFPEDEFEPVILTTTGDRHQDKKLDEIGSKGVFVDAIENALLSGEIAFAVHSMKDMPDTLPEGLAFTKAWKRETPLDALVLRKEQTLRELPEHALIGTGSKRRAYQLKLLRPDLEIVPIRGNIDTRMRKLYEPLPDGRLLDGIVVAAAALIRLGRQAQITEIFSPEEMIPAPGQGTLAIEARAEDTELIRKLDSFRDEETVGLLGMERAFLQGVGGDCHLPIGAYAEKTQAGFRLHALFGDSEGKRLARACVEGKNADPELVRQALEEIRRQMEEQ